VGKISEFNDEAGSKFGNEGCTNPGIDTDFVTKFCTVEKWKFRPVTFLIPRILVWLLDVWKNFAPVMIVTLMIKRANVFNVNSCLKFSSYDFIFYIIFILVKNHEILIVDR
jgi:hypothetical protein